MFAITADQIDSRHSPDLADDALGLLQRMGGERLTLPPDRTAGDEVQALTPDAQTALDLVLALARSQRWSIGLGIGEVRTPLPDSTRATHGSALESARAAVESAKRRPLHVAVAGDRLQPDATTLHSMLDLLLHLRQRRSPEGWELFDLLEAGNTQTEAAAVLGITPQAASKRAIAAGARLDLSARAGLRELFALADASLAENRP